jgi:hypothetical protein
VTTTVLADFNASLYDTAGYRFLGISEIADLIHLATFKGTRAPGTFVGTPIWLSGDTAGPAKPRTVWPEATSAHLALKINSNQPAVLSMVRWLVAHGG